jgi:hypothetical protein
MAEKIRKHRATESTDWGSFHIKRFSAKKRTYLCPVVGSQYGATEAADSLRAQINSQSKHITPRRENKKIRHENKIINATSDLSNDTKNIPRNHERLSL